MKKSALAFLMMMVLLSAYQGNLGLAVEGGLETNLLLDNGQQNSAQPQEQSTQSAVLFDNPMVIALMIILAILLVVVVVLIFSRSRRES